nr:O-antigen polymerase [Adlercreutzia sp. ZJ473]
MAYRLFDFDFLAPAVLYIAGFVACAFVVVLFADAWSFSMHSNTFFVISFGAVWFVFCALFVHSVCSAKLAVGAAGRAAPVMKPRRVLRLFDAPVPYSQAVIWVIIALQIGVIILSALKVCSLFPETDLISAIAGFRQSRTFDAEKLSWGFPLSPLRNFCYAIGYLIVILTAQSIHRNELCNRKLLVLSLALAIVLEMESGSRTNAVGYLLALFLLVLLQKRQEKKSGSLLSIRQVLGASIILVVFLAVFQSMAIGRSVNRGVVEYVSVYCGAQIPNLDAFLDGSLGEPAASSNLFGSMTFVRIINYLGTQLGVTEWVYELDLPFHFQNGMSLGNVYTTYYAFIYDFGYAGVGIFVSIMAVVSQLVYETAKKNPRSFFSPFLYSYLSYKLVLCFFSNKFFEAVASPTLVRLILYLIVAVILYRWLCKHASERKGRLKGIR